MIEVTEFDERRSEEITIRLNDDYQVVGVDIYFCTPVLFHNWSLERTGMVKGCGGCSEKGLPRSPVINIPGLKSKCGGV